MKITGKFLKTYASAILVFITIIAFPLITIGTTETSKSIFYRKDGKCYLCVEIDCPPTDQDDNDTPPTDQDDNDTPPTDQNDNDTPPTDQDDNDTPPTDQDDNDAPPTDQYGDTTPLTDQDDGDPPADQYSDGTPPFPKYLCPEYSIVYPESESVLPRLDVVTIMRALHQSQDAVPIKNTTICARAIPADEDALFSFTLQEADFCVRATQHDMQIYFSESSRPPGKYHLLIQPFIDDSPSIICQAEWILFEVPDGVGAGDEDGDGDGKGDSDSGGDYSNEKHCSPYVILYPESESIVSENSEITLVRMSPREYDNRFKVCLSTFRLEDTSDTKQSLQPSEVSSLIEKQCKPSNSYEIHFNLPSGIKQGKYKLIVTSSLSNTAEQNCDEFVLVHLLDQPTIPRYLPMNPVYTFGFWRMLEQRQHHDMYPAINYGYLRLPEYLAVLPKVVATYAYQRYFTDYHLNNIIVHQNQGWGRSNCDASTNSPEYKLADKPKGICKLPAKLPDIPLVSALSDQNTPISTIFISSFSSYHNNPAYNLALARRRAYYT